ncbi:MAG: mismatch-specific DNA-glycosylase [Solirubrobacterales bacterium]
MAGSKWRKSSSSFLQSHDRGIRTIARSSVSPGWLTFCPTSCAPVWGSSSAALPLGPRRPGAGAYYAGPGNAFWATLHLTGLTPVQLSPSESGRLPEFGIGLTDVCKVLHGSDEEVGTVEFDVSGLEARIAGAEPDNLAFNGKNAARAILERSVDYGAQPERIGSAAVWVLPSTSGAARRFWDIETWQALARAR